MNADHVARLLLGLSDAAIMVAGGTVVIALCALMLSGVRLFRKPRLALYEIVVPPGLPPTSMPFSAVVRMRGSRHDPSLLSLRAGRQLGCGSALPSIDATSDACRQHSRPYGLARASQPRL